MLSSISKQEAGYYFTRDKGGLTKHIQPLKLDKTKRQEWHQTELVPGPGKYDPIATQDVSRVKTEGNSRRSRPHANNRLNQTMQM